ncbi:MAG TPA: stage II sporulation protein M [Vicinamibacterales bacterium]
MISTHWLEARRGYWSRLEQLLDETARAGFTSLSRAELQELGLLYRQIAGDLAAVRSDPASARFADYLERLLARAHHTIYSAERRPPIAALRTFFSRYPAIFRRNLGPSLVSLSIFLASAVAGVLLTHRDPSLELRILGPQLMETIERREMWTHSIVAIKPVASSQIMTNNMTVALLAFAMGITGGAGTIYLIAFNGFLLGVIGTACAVAGLSVPFWSFVAPHGVLELPAIIIAGGAGLRLGQGLLFPGLLPRRESVARAGADAVRLVLGCIPILIVAGTIEAFVSPTDLAVASKFALAAALFILLTMYLFSMSRTATADPGA